MTASANINTTRLPVPTYSAASIACVGWCVRRVGPIIHAGCTAHA